MPEISGNDWDTFLSLNPDAHILQTGLWGEFKSHFGWEVVRVINMDIADHPIGAQILIKSFPLGVRMAYIPKGPVCNTAQSIEIDAWKGLWREIDEVCRRKRVFFLKVEPDLLEQPRQGGNSEQATRPIAGFLPRKVGADPSEIFEIPQGFIPGEKNIQPKRTLIVSLTGDEDRILGRMKQKTRYNVRLARKKGVIVRSSSNVGLFYDLAKDTADRDAFAVHSLEYYQWVYDIFYPRGMCQLLLAEYQGEPLAAVMVFAYGKRSWYFYGASSNHHRERMPTYLLQWEAMRWARSIGCTEYDLWGVPDEDLETLEASFTTRTDGLWGVYRFKRGFGGKLYRAVESWDKVYNTFFYSIYKLVAYRE